MSFKQTESHNILYILILVSIVFLVFWDIANLSGIRQGTEALYLQVSKEMFEANSWLTPLYRGEHHWSKPPLHFWLPFPFYKLFGGYSIFIARSTIALFSLLSVFYLSRKIQKWISFPFLLSAIIIIGSMGILKFSRTFMMENTLALLPAVSMFIFWDYLKNKKVQDLILSIVFLALSVLIKGPVTLVMAFGGLLTFQLYIFLRNKRVIVKECFLLFFFATLLSSIWFALCYIEYGKEFYEYFFVRENMGKFGQEKMPSIKIVQGLFLYLFPWVFFLPIGITYFIKKNKESLDLAVFMISLFLSFFFIWFIPAQKSHHYALPALPFALTLLIIFTKNVGLASSLIRWIQIPVNLIFIFLELLLLYFAKTNYEYVIHILLLVVWVISSYYFYKRDNGKAIAFSSLGFVVFWVLMLKIFFLPVVSIEAINIIQSSKKEIFLQDRRSYFFEEAVGRKVVAVSNREALRILDNAEGFVIGYHSRFGAQNVTKYNVRTKWKRWIRKVRYDNLKKAIAKRDLDFLKENVYLLDSLNKE